MTLKRMTPTGLAGAAAVMGSAMLLAPANAHSPAPSQNELAQLAARVAGLEAARPSTGLSFGAGANTTVTIYGYVKADFINDFDSNLGTTTFGLGSLTPGGLTGDNFQAWAFQSRLGIRTTTQTALDKLGTQIEGDFFGGGGGTFRLRHATATLGGWRIGQYWTNLTPIESYPGTLDFQGPAGIPFARPTQVRYTRAFGNGFGGSVSVEDPAGASSDPVATGALSYTSDRVFAKLAAIGGTVSGANNQVDAFGVNLSGNARLWEGGSLNLPYTMGEAISSYLVFGGPDVFDTGGTDVVIESEGITVGLGHRFNDKWAIGAAYGRREDDIGAPTGTRSLETLHFNVMYTPVENISVGLEYFTGERELFNATRVRADRLQASVQVNF